MRAILPQLHGCFHSRRSGSVCVAICLALTAPAAAQSRVDLTALDRYFAQALSDWEVPGMAVAIVKDGKPAYAKGYGIRERGKPDRVDEHTLFAIASNTKAFTSAAVAILVDRGKLRWEDAVTKFLPWFQLQDPRVTSDIRVADLLCHRSGLGTYSGDLLWYGTPYSAAEVVRRARFLKPVFPFRAGYGYSNVLFVAAGEVVAAASGKSWSVFVKEEFFEPLGMKETVTSVRELQGRSNVAAPHGPVGTGERPFPWYSWDAAAAAGGIISSVSDLSRWLLLQLGRGELEGRRYFSEDASRVMWTPHASFRISKEGESRFPTTHFSGYGLGWNLRDYQGRLVVSHGGAYDGMYSQIALVPEEKLGVVILTNGMTGIADSLAYRVIDAYLGAPERDWSREGLGRAKKRTDRRREEADKITRSRVLGTQPSRPLEAYTGIYGGDLYGTATVAIEDGKLVLRLDPNPDFVADLSHWHFDVFEIKWRKTFPWFGSGKAQFIMDNTGKIVELKLDVPNEDFWFQELDLRRK